MNRNRMKFEFQGRLAEAKLRGKLMTKKKTNNPKKDKK